MKRREFFSRGLKNYFFEVKKDLNLSSSSENIETNEQGYFSSFFSCYPLLSEAPYEQLLMAAEELGISTENKTKLEIAKEIFQERR